MNTCTNDWKALFLWIESLISTWLQSVRDCLCWDRIKTCLMTAHLPEQLTTSGTSQTDAESTFLHLRVTGSIWGFSIFVKGTSAVL